MRKEMRTTTPSRFLGAFKKGTEADIPSAAIRRVEKALAHETTVESTIRAYIIVE